mgnify:CR=1 FL=1
MNLRKNKKFLYQYYLQFYLIILLYFFRKISYFFRLLNEWYDIEMYGHLKRVKKVIDGALILLGPSQVYRETDFEKLTDMFQNVCSVEIVDVPKYRPFTSLQFDQWYIRY